MDEFRRMSHLENVDMNISALVAYDYKGTSVFTENQALKHINLKIFMKMYTLVYINFCYKIKEIALNQ